MQTPNQVIVESVAKLNEQRNEAAVNEAVRLGNCVLAEQVKIDTAKSNISRLQVEANKLAKDVIDAERILGNPLPENANKETLAKVIEAANKNRQYTVEQSGIRLRDAIVAEQDTIVLVEKRITELRTAILKINVPVVTVEQVLG